MTSCLTCGAKATLTCHTCQSPICGNHSRYYVDESNEAITKSARPQCDRCAPPKFPRPYTLWRAVAQGEYDIEEAA